MIGYVRADGVPLTESWVIRPVEQLDDTQRVLAISTRRDAEGHEVDPAAVGARSHRLLRDFAVGVLQS